MNTENVDENLVFASEDTKENVQAQSSPPQSSPQSLQPAPNPVPNPETPAVSVPIGDEEETILFTRGNIIKILIGLFVLFFVGLILFKFVFPQKGKQVDKNATLTYWGLWEDKTVMQPIISDFEKKHPNIKVDYIKQDPKQYKERLLIRMQDNTGPDIFRFHNSWTGTMTNVLLPLPSDVIKKEDFEKSFYPVAKQDLVINGGIYGIPLQVDTLALFVNTEIFQSAGLSVPTNWDEFSKDAVSLTVKDENGKIKTAGAALGTYGNVTHAPDIVSLLLIQNGVNLKKISSTRQNVIDALNYYTSFSKGESVWNDTLDESLLAFAKGNLAMYLGFSWDVFSIKYYNPQLGFQVHPVPRLIGGRNKTVASYWVEGISAKTKHPKEAFLFMNYLAQKETQQKLFTEEAKTRMFGELYSRQDLSQILSGNDLIYPFVSQAKDAESSFFAGNTNDEGFNKKLNNYLKDAVNAINNDASAETATDTLLKGVEQVLVENLK